MKHIIIWFGVFSLLLFTVSCKKDVLDSDNDSTLGQPTTLDEEDVVFSLHLDMEISTTMNPVDPTDMDNLSYLDKVAMYPDNKRTEIQLKIREGGATTWLIKDKEPTHPFEIPYEAPKSDIEPVKTTYIEDNVAYHYDKNGELLRTETIEISDMQEMLNLIAQAKSIDQQHIEDLGQQAIAKGGSMTALNEDLLEIIIPDEEGQHNILLYDKSKLRVITNSLKDAQGNLIIQVGYDYDETQTTPTMKHMNKVFYSTSGSSGIAFKTTETTTFHTFKVKNIVEATPIYQN